MEAKDLTNEIYREYDFNGRVYTIYNPVALYTREGGTTHRVLDAENVVHCVPAPGTGDCVLRWNSRDSANPVNF
jgi:hypothetical protein